MIEKHIERDFGHPWTREKGWDLLEAKSDSENELTKFIEAAERKFWKVWIIDNTGKIQVAMYKPINAINEWDDVSNAGVQAAPASRASRLERRVSRRTTSTDF